MLSSFRNASLLTSTGYHQPYFLRKILPKGYPEFLTTSAASTLGANRMPLRFLYPSSEITTNQNFPGTALIYEPVWWDK
ncbi:hypothetical protein ASE92_03835 [Pedobacter sp. Leaf41]|jgi:hypothetical protein|uniref:hypothetical protein n=1 Tax=Pedobacter sp. Leaf41 TaxID=1736218 RepID=UPI00070252A1|nr:hypothetical protein [Pedobacter sp. Leaf41]KQN38569.1 hypothetical protein ASE92_03835 [Pedobacter sp. Leaf41]